MEAGNHQNVITAGEERTRRLAAEAKDAAQARVQATVATLTEEIEGMRQALGVGRLGVK
jgi:hypothetical protein